MSPLEAAERLERLGVDLEQGAVRAVSATLEKCETRAHELSQGALSLADLARMGHPYAIRNLFALPNGDAPLAAGVVNKHSEQFDAGWTVIKPRLENDVVTGDLYNADDPVATWLEDGTKKMWKRPVNHIIGVEMEPRLAEELGREADRALQRASGS